MKSIVIGTAGHIDHGKTALVRALTGIDTDRLEEEKRRGISIDLGFAHLQLRDARISFIDVPGHEKFIKNMLAGVGGIDGVLLVVSAEESIKPQTREHFDICRLLRIPRGIVALTKCDAAAPDLVELVKLEIADFTRGSFLETAPVIATSAVTGLGLDEIKAELQKLAGALQSRDESGSFRMPVDRSFTMKGFGTVVTGTVISGIIRPEQEVEVQPSGRRLRVRNLQVHGEPANQAGAGVRAALNLAGVETSELTRGLTLVEPGRYSATGMVDASFELLPGAKPLKHGIPVHFHAATAETVAEVRLLDERHIRLILRDPVLLLPGDRFILRMFSPVTTIGGGTVLDNAPPRLNRKAAAERAARLETADLPARVALFAAESPCGCGLAAMSARTGASDERLLPYAALHEPQPWFLAPERTESLRARWKEELTKFHRAQPLAPGMPKEELRGRTLDAPAWLFDALLGASGDIAVAGDLVRLASHRLALQADEADALAKIEGAFAAAGLAVPAIAEVLAKSGVDARRARPLLQMLLRDKKLVRVSDDLVFHHSAMSSLTELLAARKGQRFAVGDFKDWTGVSRKYAIPLLEHLDRARITRREGDSRVVN